MQAHFRAIEQDRIARERVALVSAIVRAITLTVMLAVLGEFVIVSENAAKNDRAVYSQVDQQVFDSTPPPVQVQNP